MVLPSVHMSPGGGGAGGGAQRGDGGGDGVGSWRDRDLAAGQQWNRNSRHRMVDRWVDQVIRWRKKISISIVGFNNIQVQGAR